MSHNFKTGRLFLKTEKVTGDFFINIIIGLNFSNCPIIETGILKFKSYIYFSRQKFLNYFKLNQTICCNF